MGFGMVGAFRADNESNMILIKLMQLLIPVIIFSVCYVWSCLSHLRVEPGSTFVVVPRGPS
jgi:hypothetical protein